MTGESEMEAGQVKALVKGLVFGIPILCWFINLMFSWVEGIVEDRRSKHTANK